MAQEIKPAYVTFEQAKWLKEKGFEVPCQYLYVDGEYRINYEKEGDLFNNEYPSTQKPIDWCLAPEQHQVVEWLRVNHGIWIYVLPYSTLFRPYAEELVDNDKFGKWEGHKYSTPQEAYSAAFDYIKNNNLI
jgi:hypothetical protein